MLEDEGSLERPLVDLGTMAVIYNIHFKQYNKGRNQVTQLILNAMWRNVYVFYHAQYLDSPF
jgi:hypothetical protein